MSKENTDTLSQTRWNCKYHIVFASKFRRQNIYGRLKIDIGKILSKEGIKKLSWHEGKFCVFDKL